MSTTERLEYEKPAEETYVYDQHCSGCRYFWRDTLTESGNRRQKGPTCHNPQSEYCHRKSPTSWCWAWEKCGSHGGSR